MTQNTKSQRNFRRAHTDARRAFAASASFHGPTINVPLPDNLAAIVDRADWERLAAFLPGGFPPCFLNDNGGGRFYVRFTIPRGPGGARSNNGTLARLILREECVGRQVSYRDGNPLNLTRANLHLTSGRGGSREADILSPTAPGNA